MIKFTLACANGHDFEAWFGSSDAFEEQSARGLVACPVCESTDVEKALMAPSVSTARKKQVLSETVQAEIVEGLRKMRNSITENAEDVGRDFATEARAIHYGDKPERGIYGEANREEVEDLLEDGIKIAPLPILPEDAN
jgi:hypothetical protein